MILVAGLAVAGLAGIAAAFYFSMHPGGSRARAAGLGRAGDSRGPADRRRAGDSRGPADRGRAGDSRGPGDRGRTSQPPASRSDRPAGPARSARSDEDTRPARSARSAGPASDGRSGSRRAVDRTGSSTVIDFTGPQPVLDDPEPVVTGRRARRGDHLDDTPDEPGPGRRTTARRGREAATDDADQASRSRLRVAWRKGSDVDKELWPTEAFGGVSDEQFWNDLATDKPLATTARTAQPDSAARRRPPGGGPLPDLYPAEDRGRADGRRSTTEGPGTHPQPRLGPDDRTAIQPVHAGTQQSPTSPGATQPYPSATQPAATATQPVRATHQPAESRGRSRPAASADEDPLTSPAYSLRPKGSVNGQSYPSSPRSQDVTREQYRGANGANAVAGRSDVSRSDVSRSDVSRSDVSRSDVSRSDVSRSDVSRSDVSRSDVSRSDVSRSDVSRSDVSRSDVSRSDVTRSGASRSNGYRPDPPRSEPPRSEPPRSEPPRSEPPRSEPPRSEPPRSEPPRSGSTYGGTVPGSTYPYPQQPYSKRTQSMNASPQGNRYGYGNPDGYRARTSPGGDPGRANGGWNPGRAGGNGVNDGNRSSRPAYPPANGYRPPYDPPGYGRR